MDASRSLDLRRRAEWWRGVHPWVVAVIVVREILITGLRGIVEAAGKKFGADWSGKLKTVLQCSVLIGVLLLKTLQVNDWLTVALPTLDWVITGLLWVTLFTTVGSGCQYFVRAAKLLT